MSWPFASCRAQRFRALGLAISKYSFGLFGFSPPVWEVEVEASFAGGIRENLCKNKTQNNGSADPYGTHDLEMESNSTGQGFGDKPKNGFTLGARASTTD